MARTRTRRWIRPLLWIVVGVAGVVALLSVAAGPVAKAYINRHGEALTGRRVQVGHVGLNLFSGHLAVHNLGLYEEDGTTVFAGFDTLDVGVRLPALLFHRLHFRHITLAGLHANVLQEGERFNFSSLIEHFASTDTTPDPDTAASDWVLKFYNLRLSHARATYTNVDKHRSLGLPDINVRVPGFVIGADEDGQGGLNIGFARGGHLNIEADYDNSHRAYTLALNLDGFDIANLDTYLADMLVFDEVAGSVEARLTATGRTDDLMRSKIGGRVAVRHAKLTAERQTVAAFDSLTVRIADINLDDNRVDLDEVRLDGLAARYEQWKGYSNISRLLPPSEEQGLTVNTPTAPAPAPTPDPAADSAAPSKPLLLHVGALRIDGASLTYDAHTLPDMFHFPVTAIGFAADDLTTSGGNNARLRATLPGGGNLAVRWHGTLEPWKQMQELFLTVNGLDMRVLSPWTVAYTGQPIEEGVFGLTTRLTIHNSALDNHNKIDIYKARVGSRRKDVAPEMKLPLKAALYVLKDKDDKILVELPVKGNVDNPEFNYMKVVWKTLGNLLVKVATSPARAIAGALGVDGDALEFIPVGAGQQSLTSEQYHTLSTLAEVAAADTSIVYTLELRMPAATHDSTTMRIARLNRQVEEYLHEQGLTASRLTVGNAQAAEGEPTGYAIASRVNMEE